MIICEDIFAIFIYTDIAMMLKLQYSFNKWDSSTMVVVVVTLTRIVVMIMIAIVLFNKILNF